MGWVPKDFEGHFLKEDQVTLTAMVRIPEKNKNKEQNLKGVHSYINFDNFSISENTIKNIYLDKFVHSS